MSHTAHPLCRRYVFAATWTLRSSAVTWPSPPALTSAQRDARDTRQTKTELQRWAGARTANLCQHSLCESAHVQKSCVDCPRPHCRTKRTDKQESEMQKTKQNSKKQLSSNLWRATCRDAVLVTQHKYLMSYKCISCTSAGEQNKHKSSCKVDWIIKHVFFFTNLKTGSLEMESQS